MCGIFGWIKPMDDTTTELDLDKLFKEGLINSLDRGEDATGYYTLETGLVKSTEDAEEFIKEGNVLDISESRFVIGHVRMASQKYASNRANLDNVENAQPMESKNFVMAHNGSINMPKIKDYTYKSDIDSENIIAYAEKTSLRNAIASIDAGSTVVIYDKKKKTLNFWTDGGRPLVIAFYKDIIFFASTKSILLKTLKPKTMLQLFSDVAFATVYERELIEFDLVKGKFARKGEVKPKPATKEQRQETQSRINHNYFPPKNGKVHSLSKGSGSNPPTSHGKQSTSYQWKNSDPLQLDFKNDDNNPYGETARNRIIHHIKTNGSKSVYNISSKKPDDTGVEDEE